MDRDKNDVLLIAVLILGSIAVLGGSIVAAAGGFTFGNTAMKVDEQNGSILGNVNYETNDTIIGIGDLGQNQTMYNSTPFSYQINSSAVGSTLNQSVVNVTVTSPDALVPTPTPAPQGTVDVYLSGFSDPNWPAYVEVYGPSNNLYHGRMRIPNQISATGFYGLYMVSVSGSAGNMTYAGSGSVKLDSPHAEIHVNVTKV
jgi:hypothetical protein